MVTGIVTVTGGVQLLSIKVTTIEFKLHPVVYGVKVVEVAGALTTVLPHGASKLKVMST